MRVASPRIVSLVVLAMLPGLVAACGPDNLQGGLLLGAFTSSSAGTQAGNGHDRAATTAAGAVIGGIGSNEVGRQMSDRERRIAANAEYRALEYGRSARPRPGTIRLPAIAARSCRGAPIKRTTNTAAPTPIPSIGAALRRPLRASPAASRTAPGAASASSPAIAKLPLGLSARDSTPASLRGIHLRPPSQSLPLLTPFDYG